MDKNTRQLIRLARKRVERKRFKEIMAIKNEVELKEMLGRAIVLNLEKEKELIQSQIEQFERKFRDVFSVKAKLVMLSKKVEYFKVDYLHDEFKKLEILINSIRREIRELENV